MSNDVYSIISMEIEKIINDFNKEYSDNRTELYATARSNGTGKWKITLNGSKTYYLDKDEILSEISNIGELGTVIRKQLYRKIKS
ncbi:MULTISPECIES: hypothetical protein [Clostridium]|uniref:Uncharacterized protein n=1 Tax=Clostridium cibarium TaxID=2762247 RepID=A0ABR8PYJ3_9CLOT|nr:MULTISPECIES: hypothetical protein [Clostridium]MBD7913230.1 hypothetical protein [Clostridium cibarium]